MTEPGWRGGRDRRQRLSAAGALRGGVAQPRSTRFGCPFRRARRDPPGERTADFALAEFAASLQPALARRLNIPPAEPEKPSRPEPLFSARPNSLRTGNFL